MAVLFLGFFLVFSTAAQELKGRYQGLAVDQKPDGSRGVQVQLFMIFRIEGQKVVCSGSTESFDGQVPCKNVVIDGASVRFEMPFGGGVLFELKEFENWTLLDGTLRAMPGVPSPPFNTIELKRVGDLALTDRSPRLEWESSDRSPVILQLRKSIADGGQVMAVADFWKNVEKSGTPLIEAVPGSNRSVLATFVWKGKPATKNVFLLWPRLSYAHPDDYFFSHIPGTDIWFKTIKLRSDMRIYYQISPDDPLGERPEGQWTRNAQADPLNPKRDNNDASAAPEQVRSLLEMPDVRSEPWYIKRPDVARYSSSELEIQSAKLKSKRKVKVYLPPGFSAQQRPYPSIYLTDGEDSDGLVFATWTFENLLADRKIPATVVVRIVNPDQETRNRELACDDTFADYLSEELVPFIQANFNTSREPSKTAIGGYSLGGLAASYAAFRHPNAFGMVLSQSGSYWFEPSHKEFAEPNWLARQFAEYEKLPLRFYLDAGSNELDLRGDGSGILVPNRQFRDVLKAKGYEVLYDEFAGDHDYINWRGTLADGLIYLFDGVR